MATNTKTTKAIVDLIVDGKSAMVSVRDYGNALKTANKELKEMKQLENEAPAKFKARRDAKVKETTMIRNEFLKQKAAIGEVKTAWSQFVAGSSKIAAGIFGGAVALGVLEKLKAGVVALFLLAGKLSDELANVSKATGMNAKEVTEFNESIKKIDTRTSFEELRGIAEIGGRFGVAKEEVDNFTESTDKLNVAFGDQFSSVEEMTDQVLKMRNIFLDIKSDNIGDDILHIGNAMNVLEADGAATGKGKADLASRIGGVAIPLGLTSGQVLGLSAALEELNVTPERGATAVNTILQKMLTDTAAFAKVAKMEVKDFEHLLNTDLMGAFMAFAKGAKDGGSTATAFAGILADTRLEGSGASEVLLKLASNQDMVNDKVNKGTEALKNSSSVMNEFNVKNQNAQAIMDKAWKRWDGFVEGLAADMFPMIETFGKWLGVVNEIDLQLGDLNEQQDKVMKAESKLPALIKRYDELKKETNLSGAKQKELRDIIKQISDVAPLAATGFDSYGNALDISKDKVTKFIEEQKGLLEAMRQTRRKLLVDETQSLDEQAKAIQKRLNAGGMTMDLGMGQFRKISFDDYQLKDMQRELAQIQATIASRRQDLRALEGIDDINTRREGRYGKKPVVKKGGDKPTGAKPLSEKEVKEQEKIFDQLIKRQQKFTMDSMSEYEKELQAAHYFYEELRAKAKGNSTQLTEINELEKKELSEINGRYNKKYLTSMDKLFRAELDAANTKRKGEFDYEQTRANDLEKRRDKELFEINNHYRKSLAEAIVNGNSIVEIEKAWRAEVANLDKERAAKLTDASINEMEDKYKNEVALARLHGDNMLGVIEAQLTALHAKKVENANKDIELERWLNSEIAELEADKVSMQVQNIQTLGDAFTSGNQALSDILSLAASNQAENAEFQKAIGLFQIAIETSTAIAAAVASATKGDPYTTALRIGAAVAAVTGAMVKAKALMSQSEIPAIPTFKYGGFTDTKSLNERTGGYFGRATMFSSGPRQYIAGEAGKEFITSSTSLQYPAVAAFSEMLNAVQQSRNYQVLGQLGQPGSSGSILNGNSNMINDPRIDETNRLLRVLIEKQGMNWDYRVFEEYKDRVEEVRSRATA